MLRSVVFLMALLLAHSAAVAEKRIALLIGNRDYDASVGKLKNPHNDIAVVGEALTGQGFELIPPIKDASRSAILGGVRELVRRLNVAGSGRWIHLLLGPRRGREGHQHQLPDPHRCQGARHCRVLG